MPRHPNSLATPGLSAEGVKQPAKPVLVYVLSTVDSFLLILFGFVWRKLGGSGQNCDPRSEIGDRCITCLNPLKLQQIRSHDVSSAVISSKRVGAHQLVIAGMPYNIKVM